MQEAWNELAAEFHDSTHLGRVLLRLTIAAILGGVIGFERSRDGRSAGLRTHMLVALGAAIFALAGTSKEMTHDDLSRIIQGIVAGVGFLGAGNIIKIAEQHKVEGLTTAASMWVTAAAGMSVGAGWYWPSIVGTFLVWMILRHGYKIETKLLHCKPDASPSSESHQPPAA
jgi:putative Mg2+ transporter-C (MgtC) family protein